MNDVGQVVIQTIDLSIHMHKAFTLYMLSYIMYLKEKKSCANVLKNALLMLYFIYVDIWNDA